MKIVMVVRTGRLEKFNYVNGREDTKTRAVAEMKLDGKRSRGRTIGMEEHYHERMTLLEMYDYPISEVICHFTNMPLAANP